MTEPLQGNRLARAYQQMMERARSRLEEFEQAEKAAFPQLSASIEHAAEKAVELGELTREEARLIGGYLRRDLEDAGYYLATTGRDLKEWMRFDLELIEERLLDFFRRGVDQSRLELSAFGAALLEETQAEHYRSGEVTGPGTLRCEQCGERVVFHAPALIEPCPVCEGTGFVRVAGDL
ncbi:MAG TPA: zinc ribbon-containing protein [Candidatus Competibacter sp.]|nr:zinc ribbon-containing protein [Candidatus Competibacter sp.]